MPNPYQAAAASDVKYSAAKQDESEEPRPLCRVRFCWGRKEGGSLCCEAEGAETKNTWSYVGDGLGDFDSKETMNYVGDGLGSWEKQTVTTYAGMRLRPWVICASGLLAVFLALCLAGFLARVLLGVAGGNNDSNTAARGTAGTSGTTAGESASAVRVTASPGTSTPVGDASSNSDDHAATAAAATTGSADASTAGSTILPSSQGEDALQNSPCACPDNGSRKRSCLCAAEKDACRIARQNRTFKQVVLCRLQKKPRLSGRTVSPTLGSFSTASPEPFNCLSREVFTEGKRQWCCTNKHLGCTTTKDPLRRRGLLRLRST
mmetsp:Transcript_17869/g.34387  ORF Transcript_17869/g.34387 Transcript_17869/m.34387 type:complete len:320 (-) Transcript_17869:20-979(-)